MRFFKYLYHNYMWNKELRNVEKYIEAEKPLYEYHLAKVVYHREKCNEYFPELNDYREDD